MAINKGDFIEVEYTGSLKENNIIFDTTQADKAKKAGIFSPKTKYGPVVICLGQGQLIPGLDEELVGKEVGKEYKFDVSAKNAFGEKSAKLIQMIPLNKFKNDNIRPMPGLQVNVDGAIGVIKTVSGGRVLVDFNHPLAGQDVVYEIKATKLVEDPAEKIKAMLELQFKMPDVEVDFKEGVATIKSKIELPDKLLPIMTKSIQESVPELKEIKFEKK